MKRFILAAATILCVTACHQRPTAPVPVTTPSVSTQVYDVIVDSLYRGNRPDTVLIGDSTTVFRLPRGNEVSNWRQAFDAIPRALTTELARTSAARMHAPMLPLPRGSRIITTTELRAIFTDGPRSWPEFYRRFPRQRMWIELSPIAFNADSSQALLYREYHCGGLCGAGDLVWLEKMPAGRWRIRRKVGYWVS